MTKHNKKDISATQDQSKTFTSPSPHKKFYL